MLNVYAVAVKQLSSPNKKDRQSSPSVARRQLAFATKKIRPPQVTAARFLMKLLISVRRRINRIARRDAVQLHFKQYPPPVLYLTARCNNMRPTVEAFGGRTAVNGGFANSSSDAARANVTKSTDGLSSSQEFARRNLRSVNAASVTATG